jgi:hypothetical protein
MAQCMAMGAAAGVTAALATKAKKTIREIEVSEVQTKLREGGAILSLQ